MAWVEKYGVLADYQKEDLEKVSTARLASMYATMPPIWRGNLYYHYGGFYPDLPPAVTYCAHILVGKPPYGSRERALAESERLELIYVEWHRQVYANYKLYRLSSWCFYQITKMAPRIGKVLGNKRNTEDLVAFVSRTRELRPEWFSPAQVRGRPLYINSRYSEFSALYPWANVLLRGEGRRQRLYKDLPDYYQDMLTEMDWKLRHDDVCFLNVLAVSELPWQKPKIVGPFS